MQVLIWDLFPNGRVVLVTAGAAGICREFQNRENNPSNFELHAKIIKYDTIDGTVLR